MPGMQKRPNGRRHLKNTRGRAMIASEAEQIMERLARKLRAANPGLTEERAKKEIIEMLKKKHAHA